MKSCNFLFLILFVALHTVLYAQKENRFFQNLTWEQAAEKAEKEGKIVLVDAMMTPRDAKAKQAKVQEEKNLLKIKDVADFLQQNVIAIHMDMGTEAGKAFAPKLVMNMYPTYGFFMPNGDILGVVSPFILAKDPMALVKKGEEALKLASVKRNNNRKIIFQNLTLENALKQAEQENKLVFIDAYTAWCQPCVMMEKNVFSLNSVADFYNEHFINVKIDFGKEKALAEKFNVSGYPSFIFVNGKGKTVYLGGGYTEEKEFIGYGEQALSLAKGIAFEKGTWEEALKKAGKENKLIFMDCYTSWCGPCKMLAKDVFTDPEVAKFFNEKFVNVKVDMEKGEGKMLKEKYGVSAFPTLLFIDTKGEAEHCIVGAGEAEWLLKEAQKALDGEGLLALNRKYAEGNREPEFITDYMEALGTANKNEEAERVCLEYFSTLDKTKLQEKAYWDLFAKYVNDVNSEVFAYVYENREALCEAIGKREVRRKISSVWAIGANSFVKKIGEDVTCDAKGFRKYVKKLAKADVDGREMIISDAKMSNAEKLGDWKTYIDLGTERLKEGGVSDLLLYNWGLRIDRMCQDSGLRTEAAKWFDDAAALAAQKEKEGKTGMMSYRTFFEKLAVNLKAPWQEK